MRTRLRRLCVLALVVAFGLGAILNGGQAADMAAKMAVMAAPADGQQDGCGLCGSDDGMTSAVCDQVCVSFAAVVPASPVAAAPMSITLPSALALAVIGRTGPPEPYPPKALAMV